MPLASELTSELKRWLTPQKLRRFNESWRSQGGGYPDSVIDDFVELHSRSDLLYEDILGYLETEHMRQSPASPHHAHLYAWLLQMVYFLLYLRHVNNKDPIRHRLKYYEGLAALADANRPLWIFSLNHDLILECLAYSMDDLPLNAGFSQEIIALPRRDKARKVIGQLRAEVLRGEDLKQSAMPFFAEGTRGINLLKIHGGLDIFTFRDGKDLVRILPVENSVDGVLEAIRATNEDMNYDPNNPVLATNEIAYADDSGEMQFLRRSLLAGAHKYDRRGSQVIPWPLLRHFRSYINHLQVLICVGYSFGDSHINQVIREWLEFGQKRRVVVVGPEVESIPHGYRHLAPQIELQRTTATNFLDSVAGIVRSKEEQTEKRLAGWLRDADDAAKRALRMFVRHEVRNSLMEWLKTLPMRNGSLDVSSVGMSRQELGEDGKRRASRAYSVAVERFLAG